MAGGVSRGPKGPPPKPPPLPREVLFEIQRAGSYVRVAAIDADTGTEVVMAGPAHLGLFSLKRNAARKLAYVLDKQRRGRGGA